MSRLLLIVPMVLIAAAAVAAEDELTALLTEVDPPARFAAHVPRFTIEEVEHVHRQRPAGAFPDGTQPMTYFVIKDGERCVAVMQKGQDRRDSFWSGVLVMLTFQPGEGPLEPPLPSERFHCDTLPGCALRTDHFLPEKLWNMGFGDGEPDVSHWEVAEDGRSVTLIRRFAGTTRMDRWEVKTGEEPWRIDTENRFVLSVDPRLGYVVDASWESGVDPAPKRSQYFSLYPPSMSHPWPDHPSVQRVVTCRPGTEGWIGYAMNHNAIDWHGSDRLGCRDGGFTAYLDRGGWSPAMILHGAEAWFGVCNVHADLDYSIRWPENPPAGRSGLPTFGFGARLLALPPELTESVWERMTVQHAGRKAFCLRLGVTEDFEDAVYPATEYRKGLTLTHLREPESLLGDVARSGCKSLRVQGLFWLNLPQIVLEPDTRYRVEAWVKVAEPDAAARAAHRAAYDQQVARERERHANKNAKQITRGEDPLPPYEPPVYDGEPRAWISADLCEWTPHSSERTGRHRTDAALPGDWQRVALEFTADDWGPFADLRFHTAGGAVAWFDDFRFAPVEPGE